MKKVEPYSWRSLDMPVIGLDEVGRGCLAGPVVAAAALLPPSYQLKGLTDSKLLSEMRREELAESLFKEVRYGIGVASVLEIEKFNILRASLMAMTRALAALKIGAGPGLLLVDGTFRVPEVEGDWEQVLLTKGELRAEPIAAASVIAKVTRDRFMMELAERYPAYGFDSNKGYGTLPHREAIQQKGPCVYHRREFAGVREFWPVPLTSHAGTYLRV